MHSSTKHASGQKASEQTEAQDRSEGGEAATQPTRPKVWYSVQNVLSSWE